MLITLTYRLLITIQRIDRNVHSWVYRTPFCLRCLQCAAAKLWRSVAAIKFDFFIMDPMIRFKYDPRALKSRSDRLRTGRRNRISLSLLRVKTDCGGPTQATTIQWVPGALSPEVKQPGRQTAQPLTNPKHATSNSECYLRPPVRAWLSTKWTKFHCRTQTICDCLWSNDELHSASCGCTRITWAKHTDNLPAAPNHYASIATDQLVTTN
jgi:hypothetical protein